MKPIDGIGPNGIARLNSGAASRVAASDAGRAVGGDQAAARQTVAQAAAHNAARAASPTRAVAGASAPVDTDRVAVIRKAVEQGRYPVVPTRIADAMIAAGYLLRTPK